MTQAERDLRPDTRARLRAPVGHRWAVIVGISRYASPQLTLQYAHRDAEKLHEFLLTPAGGAFAPERIRLLRDEEATTRAVTQAVRSFLAQTEDDDLVLIYFACHGAPDTTAPARPLFLLTHDCDPDDIAGTAMPMEQIAWALDNYVRASRVVILADTCHSAGLAGARGADDLGAAAVNRYLDALSQTKAGVAYLTSAREDQRSFEDVRWGGGHGAFTWFLLEGMRGEADGFNGRPKDGVVGLGELAEYVTERVFADTQRRQQPVLGTGRYDLELPMAVAGGLDAEQHVVLARALLEVGWMLDDPAPFRAAAREAMTAIEFAELTGAALPAGHALAGEALLAAREPAEAVSVLERAAKRFGPAFTPEASLHLGLGNAALGQDDPAAVLLAEFADAVPEAVDAAWSRDYANQLRAQGTVYALLVGVGRYGSGLPSLAGPANDLQLMREVLTNTFGASPEHLWVLADDAATTGQVIAALRALVGTVSGADTVVVYFSGHASKGRGSDDDGPYLILADTQLGPTVSGGVRPSELHTLLGALPAANVLAVLDTDANRAFHDLMAADPVATVLCACGPEQSALEGILDGQRVGAFTGALAGVLRDGPDLTDRTYGDVLAETTSRIALRYAQTPALLGDPTAAVLRHRFDAAELWRLSRVRCPLPPSQRVLRAARAGGWPTASRLLARDALDQGRTADGLALLRENCQLRGATAGWLELAGEALAADRTDDVLDALGEIERLPAARRGEADPAPAAAAVRALATGRRRAVVVAVAQYADPQRTAPPEARAAAEEMRAFLDDRGFGASDVTMLLDGDATRDRILHEVRALAGHCAEQLGVLHIVAEGTGLESDPRLLPVDARADGGGAIALTELRAAVGSAPGLLTVLDTRWGGGSPAYPRVEAGAELSGDVSDLGSLLPPSPATAEPIGAVLLLPQTSQRSQTPPPTAVSFTRTILEAVPATPPPTAVSFTRTLLKAVPATGTYTDWAAQATAAGLATAALGATGEQVLRHHPLHRAAQTELTRLEHAPAQVAVDLLHRLVARADERTERCPVTYLELGLAYAALGHRDEAVRFLRTARNQYDDPDVRADQETVDPHVDVWHREARYHLGRLLYEYSADADALNEAVTALRQAHHQAPTDPRTCLHLGLAIRALVERQTLVEAETLLRTYLQLGAPLGQVEQVMRALLAGASRTAAELSSELTRRHQYATSAISNIR